MRDSRLKKTIHVVPHQHFDIVWRRPVKWYARWRQELISQILDMLGREPVFTFSLCQASALREFIKRAPSRKSEIVRHLADGRLEIVGGSETLCDVNLSSGPAIIRNIEHGRDWFLNELGHKVEIGSFEDAFGVSAQLPAILNLAGYRFYKASRMPVKGIEGLSGDFRWEGLDGTIVRCVSPRAPNSDWGWGCADNPDDPRKPTTAMRRAKIRTSLMRAVETRAEHVLFVVMGEEQEIYEGIVDLLPDVSSETSAQFMFSTFSRYYATISEARWKTSPLVSKETDLSRLFTACYSTRTESKRRPRSLEHRLLGAEMSEAVSGANSKNRDKAWRVLFLSQFHDAICGCHIKENASYLGRMAAAVSKNVVADSWLVPWEPSIPAVSCRMRLVNPPYDGIHKAGPISVEVRDGRLSSIVVDGKRLGDVCHVSLREDSGTLWTEEYSGRSHTCMDPDAVVRLDDGDDALVVTVEGAAPGFRKMWPGFSSLSWRKIYTIYKRGGFIGVDMEFDFLGNSTEVALLWESEELDSCVAEIPFGSVEREPHASAAELMVGDAFPALNWVRSRGFVVFNRGTPGHALRAGRLETILFRSPVKRWSPWFPVTPDSSCWENGKTHFSLLWMPVGAGVTNADLHRIGYEFNLGAPVRRSEVNCLEGIPRNVVVASMRRVGKVTELLAFEADGKRTVWKNKIIGDVMFKPRELRKIQFGG